MRRFAEVILSETQRRRIRVFVSLMLVIVLAFSLLAIMPSLCLRLGLHPQVKPGIRNLQANGAQ